MFRIVHRCNPYTNGMLVYFLLFFHKCHIACLHTLHFVIPPVWPEINRPEMRVHTVQVVHLEEFRISLRTLDMQNTFVHSGLTIWKYGPLNTNNRKRGSMVAFLVCCRLFCRCNTLKLGHSPFFLGVLYWSPRNGEHHLSSAPRHPQMLHPFSLSDFSESQRKK